MTSDIVWINEPFAAGKFNDNLIFRDSLITYLGPCARVETDHGYTGKIPQHVKCPISVTSPVEMKEIQGMVRNRQ